jgi:tRNA (adenine37-N6)-methyltransferase
LRPPPRRDTLNLVFWRRKQPAFERPDPPREVTLAAIATVRNDVQKPRPRGWDRVTSRLEFAPEHLPRLLGLDAYSHAIVVFYMDLALDAPEKPDQLTLESGHRYGILATRSQLRPNHLGVSVVEIRGLEGATLTVKGLDAIDGTPIFDVKPYLPEYDSVPSARIPFG